MHHPPLLFSTKYKAGNIADDHNDDEGENMLLFFDMESRSRDLLLLPRTIRFQLFLVFLLRRRDAQHTPQAHDDLDSARSVSCSGTNSAETDSAVRDRINQ